MVKNCGELDTQNLTNGNNAFAAKPHRIWAEVFASSATSTSDPAPPGGSQVGHMGAQGALTGGEQIMQYVRTTSQTFAEQNEST